jgi:hypothetical protein
VHPQPGFEEVVLTNLATELDILNAQGKEAIDLIFASEALAMPATDDNSWAEFKVDVVE